MSQPVPEYCTYKTELVKERTPFLCEKAAEILAAMAEFCKDRALPLEITDAVSTPEEDKELSRVSDEHSTGRAFDLSIHGWLELAVQDFTNEFNGRFLSLGAISKQTGQPRLIFRHDNGHGEHLHVQVARVYGLANPLKKDSPPAEESIART